VMMACQETTEAHLEWLKIEDSLPRSDGGQSREDRAKSRNGAVRRGPQG
jgi:hypothetical protein